MNGRAARAAAERLVAFEPRRVIVSPGRPINRDAAAELRRRFAWLRPARVALPNRSATSRDHSAASFITLAAVGLLLGAKLVRRRSPIV